MCVIWPPHPLCASVWPLTSRAGRCRNRLPKNVYNAIDLLIGDDERRRDAHNVAAHPADEPARPTFLQYTFTDFARCIERLFRRFVFDELDAGHQSEAAHI